MKNQALVSIITPAYNCERYLAHTIESVISQSYKNWEMIIVNDNSVDDTAKIINIYTQQDNRIRVINLSRNEGAAVARNTALDKAKGRYIAFLDSDDAWKPDKLKTQIDFMENNGYSFTFTAYEYLLDENNQQKKVFWVPKRLSYNEALKNTAIGCLTVIIDKEVIGDFRMPLVRRGQDNLTWLMLLSEGNIAHGLNVNLADYRRVPGSLSNNKLVAIKRQWKNYRNELHIPILKCLYYYGHYIFNNIKKYYF